MRKTSPRVSVITPVYRGAATLERALQSVAWQRFTDWECIIVDDGSPDASWQIAEPFTHFDRRFALIRCPNRGVGAARNTGLAAARGEFVLFLDSDDWLEPDAIEQLLKACQASGRSAVHGRFRYHTHDGRPTEWVGGYCGSAPIFEALSASNVLSMPAAVLVRRSVLAAVGGFDESLRTCGDWDLWGRVARCRGRGIGRIDACVAGYRMRSASLSHNPTALLRDARTVLDRLHADDPRVSDPNWALAEGASARQLPMRRARFALYAAGLAISEGLASVVTSIVESAEQWQTVTPSDAAEYLLSALCFARCRGLESIGDFWLDVEPRLIAALRWIETRGAYDHFTDNVLSAISHQSGRARGPEDLATIVS